MICPFAQMNELGVGCGTRCVEVAYEVMGVGGGASRGVYDFITDCFIAG